MKERPIVFSAEMVRAILEGRKTMTRRLVKHPQLTNANELDKHFGGGACEDCDACFYADPKDSSRICLMCPYGKPGDRLWVKEAWMPNTVLPLEHRPQGDVIYRASQKRSHDGQDTYSGAWKSPRFMPRWASRILLEIVSVRVERVQDISREDAWQEGVACTSWSEEDWVDSDGYGTPLNRRWDKAYEDFAELWNKIHRKKPESQWDANPWVWVIEFNVVTA